MNACISLEISLHRNCISSSKQACIFFCCLTSNAQSNVYDADGTWDCAGISILVKFFLNCTRIVYNMLEKRIEFYLESWFRYFKAGVLNQSSRGPQWKEMVPNFECFILNRIMNIFILQLLKSGRRERRRSRYSMVAGGKLREWVPAPECSSCLSVKKKGHIV